MALVQSERLSPGVQLPQISLPDPSGQQHNSAAEMGKKGLLVVFTCNHCPYAIAIWPRLIDFASKISALGIHTLAINPNIHPEYPEDSPAKMAEKIQAWGIPFPYLIDETQETAKAYNAQCTPDIYLLDASQTLVYHGRFDDNWKDETAVSEQSLADAVAHFDKTGNAISVQHPSMGCSIKWRT